MDSLCQGRGSLSLKGSRDELLLSCVLDGVSRIVLVSDVVVVPVHVVRELIAHQDSSRSTSSDGRTHEQRHVCKGTTINGGQPKRERDDDFDADAAGWEEQQDVLPVQKLALGAAVAYARREKGLVVAERAERKIGRASCRERV